MNSDFEDNAVKLMIEAHHEGMSRFISWCEKNWRHEPAEKWPNEEPHPGEQFAKGWDAAIDGLRAAFECYAEDRHG